MYKLLMSNFPGFNTQQSLKSFNFWQSCLKNIKVGVLYAAFDKFNSWINYELSPTGFTASNKQILFVSGRCGSSCQIRCIRMYPTLIVDAAIVSRQAVSRPRAQLKTVIFWHYACMPRSTAKTSVDNCLPAFSTLWQTKHAAQTTSLPRLLRLTI